MKFHRIGGESITIIIAKLQSQGWLSQFPNILPLKPYLTWKSNLRPHSLELATTRPMRYAGNIIG